MGSLFTALFSKLSGIVGWLGKLFVSVFVALWDILRDGFAWLFDQVMSVAVSAVGAIDTSGVSTTAWGSLPADVVNIMQLLGVGSAIGIIATAIGIRIALQLIPFVRLGS